MNKIDVHKMECSLNDYCRIYTICSIIAYVLLLMIPPCAFLMPISALAPYCNVLSIAYLVLEMRVIPKGPYVIVLMVVSVLICLIMFYAVVHMARKNKYVPFLVFVLSNYALCALPFVLAYFSGTIRVPRFDVICGMVGNAVFVILFTRKYWIESRGKSNKAMDDCTDV